MTAVRWADEWPLAAGVVLGLLAVVETALRANGSGTDLTGPLLLGLGATAPLALSRGYPVAAATLITTATAVTVAVDLRPTVAGLVALLGVWFLLGRHRVRRVRAEAAERHASRLAVEDTLLQLTARGERARIARELHDVVAHHISMISVQAETARLATPGMPADGASQLLAIGNTARQALTEMRRLLGVLREDAGTEPTRRPQPGLQQLIELIDEARDSSRTSTRLLVSGQVAALDPGVELTAYRIVQEALTNARRHAPGAAVDVELEYAEDALLLRVRDNGPGAATGGARPGMTTGTSAGHGLLGMRERAAAVGGTLSAGPAGTTGFVVEASLPRAS